MQLSCFGFREHNNFPIKERRKRIECFFDGESHRGDAAAEEN